ncbi:hypothetical protein N657DRAFT_657437 [Parathielavia appendiculata]|uniref:Zn(2)-C6 fungal-type domain-containing protein n=1 Tax=Parathielavia appendiculata TaxID=2587402 RepID=A0AAN6TWA0_9PEZI|nr:hypothetical protein N657DRAFT_657437 [Parathielavia appendiculata]
MHPPVRPPLQPLLYGLPPPFGPQLDLALQACQSSRSRKRKCDKALPKCSSCAKRTQTYEYWRPETSTPLEREWYPSAVGEEQQAEDWTVDFPTILFLDPSLLRHGQVDSGHGAMPVPPSILHLLGSVDEVRSTADRFFQHIHQWMPLISKKRSYDLYFHRQPAFHSHSDVALLLLAVKLITTFPPAGPRDFRTPLYYTTKHFHLEVETLYELDLAHGIFPAVYLSIGSVHVMPHALGINLNASRTVPTRKVLTLVEVEERRRVWWAIVVLDWFVSIGCPGRPFATADPALDNLLPADDAACRLLGQVLHHLASGAAIHDSDEVWMQLDRTLRSMLAAALDIEFQLAAHQPCPDRPDASSERSRRARVVLEQITDRISANLVERQCLLGRDPEDMAPWGLYFAFRVCCALVRAPQQTPQAVAVIQTLSHVFRAIDVRWNVAGLYLQLLEAQEAIHLGGLIQFAAR